MTKGINI